MDKTIVFGVFKCNGCGYREVVSPDCKKRKLLAVIHGRVMLDVVVYRRWLARL